MHPHPGLPWQPSLFGAPAADFDRTFAAVQRRPLDATAWVDHAPGWVRGADTLFTAVLQARTWAQRTRRLWEQDRLEPRLTSAWHLESGEPLEPPLVDAMRVALAQRYGVGFDSVGFNLYRNGRDSVAWHGDKIRREIAEPIVVLVSLGEPRRFLLRPRSSGGSIAYLLGHGDLLVTGGTTQRTWQHCVPKVAKAGPRISIAFRHGMTAGAYGADAGAAPGPVTDPSRV